MLVIDYVNYVKWTFCTGQIFFHYVYRLHTTFSDVWVCSHAQAALWCSGAHVWIINCCYTVVGAFLLYTLYCSCMNSYGEAACLRTWPSRPKNPDLFNPMLCSLLEKYPHLLSVMSMSLYTAKKFVFILFYYYLIITKCTPKQLFNLQFCNDNRHPPTLS